LCDARAMTAIVEHQSRARERMTRVLDSLAQDLWPRGSCPACRTVPAGRCPACTRAVADSRIVNTAIAAIENAPAEADALAAYQACLHALVKVRLLMRHWQGWGQAARA
jgi:hypothetical protein